MTNKATTRKDSEKCSRRQSERQRKARDNETFIQEKTSIKDIGTVTRQQNNIAKQSKTAKPDNQTRQHTAQTTVVLVTVASLHQSKRGWYRLDRSKRGCHRLLAFNQTDPQSQLQRLQRNDHVIREVEQSGAQGCVGKHACRRATGRGHDYRER